MDVKTHYCSFCGESEHDLKALIKGPSALICDACVALWNCSRTRAIGRQFLVVLEFPNQSGGGRVMRNYRKGKCTRGRRLGNGPGYMAGKDGLRAKRSTAAYMHGYRNGVSDRTGVPRTRQSVLRRRAGDDPRYHYRAEVGKWLTPDSTSATTDRQRAIAILQRVDLTEGKTWSLHDEARSDAQNRRMWAMLRDISQQVEWYGRKLDDELEAHLQRGGTATGTLFPASTAASWSSAYRPASSQRSGSTKCSW